MPRKETEWIKLVKMMMKKHKGKPLKEILKIAKEHYRK